MAREYPRLFAAACRASRDQLIGLMKFLYSRNKCNLKYSLFDRNSIVHDRSGSVAVVAALMGVVLVGAAGIVVDYSLWTNNKQKLQNAVDSAALAAAGELRLGIVENERLLAIAESVIDSVYSLEDGGGAVSISAELGTDRRSVTVSASQPQQMIMSRVVASKPTEIRASASARLNGTMTLCLLALDPTFEKSIALTVNSQLSAAGCDAQANSTSPSGIFTGGNAGIEARLTCASGGFGGTIRIRGERNSDCPIIPDPLASRPPPPVEGCKHNDLDIKNQGNVMLTPGTYCGGIQIGTNSNVVFQPGVYVIKDGPFIIAANAEVSGTGVGFYFVGNAGQATVFSAGPQSSIDFSAPIDGPLAGILFFEDRNAPLLRVFEILSDKARNLLGTFYTPNGQFSVRSGQPVGDASAFTVIVARRVELSASPRLTLNANYNDTDVPVPDGVGPRGQIFLNR